MSLDLLYKDAFISLNPNNVLSRVHLPSLLSNVLLVYRVTAIYAEGQFCSGELNCCNLCLCRSTAHRNIEPLLPPLLEHSSFSEAHFHPLTQSRSLLLHTHTGIFASAHRLVGYARPCWRSILDCCARMGRWYRYVVDVYRYGHE